MRLVHVWLFPLYYIGSYECGFFFSCGLGKRTVEQFKFIIWCGIA